MLPQPGIGSPSTNALSQIMRGRQAAPPMGGDAMFQSSPTEGVAPPAEGVWHSSPTEGVAPPPGEAMWHSSPTEGIAPTTPVPPHAGVPEGASTDDQGRVIPGQYRGDTPAPPQQAPAPQGGGKSPRRSPGRRHMMHGGGGMMGAPSIQSLSRLFGGFGQGGY